MSQVRSMSIMNGPTGPPYIVPRAVGDPLRIPPPRVRIDDGSQYGVDAVLGGSYDILSLEFPHAPVILDIGANIGCATMWFKARYPDATVHAYEPFTLCVAALIINTWGCADVLVHPVGVVGGKTVPGEKRPLCLGLIGTYANSFHKQEGEQGEATIGAVVEPAAGLPRCDILKIDTEGSEVEILSDYPHISTVSAVMLEYHSPSDHEWILGFLRRSGFSLLKDEPSCNIRGDMIAMRPLAREYDAKERR